ncbi:MAG: inositol-3-phosphate synthase [Mariprofundaceae bacterium]|nr:inositol-3-phosphate synthase [Mariprofundaceae bacterium]
MPKEIGLKNVKVAIAGVGNCASALVQGIHFYTPEKRESAIGLMHWEIGGYAPHHLKIVAAFDIDRRKVGRDVHEAIFAAPNCTTVFCNGLPSGGTVVRMGKVLDGVSEHMAQYPDENTFMVADAPEASKDDIVQALKESGADVLINYMPVGSEQATRLYAECALDAGVAFVNCMPAFIASDPEWAKRFAAAGLPIIGDDIKSQLGATITHRMLTSLFARRGIKIDRTYQLNTGGNTDFLNMLNRTRLASKKESKTEAVQSILPERLNDQNIHIGPSDYVPWQKDNKVAFIRMEGRMFGDVPMHLEMRLSVEDSPNSAGVVIDAVRCCKLARDRNLAGIVEGPSAFFMKHPPKQYGDEIAWRMTEAFIAGDQAANTPADSDDAEPETFAARL